MPLPRVFEAVHLNSAAGVIGNQVTVAFLPPLSSVPSEQSLPVPVQI